MARIKDSSVRDVVDAADIVELVSARTQLRRVGARYTGRCPFHEERTPSFSVNAQDKLYYCFGCGKGGDVITFVRETESLDFAEAVEWLAERYRVPLEYEESSPRREAERSRRERLHALLERATVFYEHALWQSTAGAAARDYLASRGLAEEVCREYRLGYAPGGPMLARKAKESGFTQVELAAAGLANRRGNDYFSGRLLFPLADARGRVVGFGARRLYEDDPLRAKYVNSPEGELFHKQAVVYGLDRARDAIAKEDRVVVVEGYTDVLALRQAGLLPVVASMGTALTERQLKELARHTQRLYLCFDADAAGEAATLRGMELAVRASFDVKIVPLEPGTDPADDPAALDRRLAAAESYARYRVRIEIERAPDRQTAYQRVREVLNGLEESVDRHDAWQYANDRLGMTVQIQATGATQMSQPVSPRLLEAGPRLERDALAGFVAHPQLVHLLADLSPQHFDDELHRRLREHLVEPGQTPPDLLQLLAELDARAAAEGIDEETAKELLLRLRERKLRRELAATSDLTRTKELQELLSRVRATAGDLA